MNATTKAQLQEWYTEVRPELQAALDETHHIRTSIITIAQEHTLTKDQARALEYEVVLVLLELRPFPDLVANIEIALEVPRAVARAVQNDVAMHIFSGLEKALATSAAEQKKLAAATNPDITNAKNGTYLTKDELLNSLKQKETQISYSAHAQDAAHKQHAAASFTPSGSRKAEFEAPTTVQRGYGAPDDTLEKQPIPRYKKPLTHTPEYDTQDQTPRTP